MNLNKEFGRQPFQVVRVYLDQCGQPGFGQGTCAGTGEPCYFGVATCTSQSTYIHSAGTLELIWCSQTARIPDGLYGAIPCLLKVSQTPPILEPSGGMGVRAKVSVVAADFPHSDIGMDPSVFFRSYDPMEQGTYFGKLRARNPYYTGRHLQVLNGYLTDDGAFLEENFEIKNYFIDAWVGPAGGQISITAKDVLRLAGDDKAQAPFVSRGRLEVDIDDLSTTVKLLPAGIGEIDYPASGVGRLGKELVTYTRVGDDLTLVRAQFGTQPDEHKMDDAFQLCLNISAMKPQDILYLLLSTYAKVLPEYLDKPQWDAEQVNHLPRLYSAIITSPTGVTKLIGEICEQMGFYIWWDEVAQKVKLRAVRPAAAAELKVLTEYANIDDSSVKSKDLVNERFNEAWIFYGVIDPTGKLEEPNNYRGQFALPALPEQDITRDADVRIKQVFSRWISTENAVAAYDLADKIVARSKATPIELTFSFDAKDSDIELGDFVSVETRAKQTVTGAPGVVPVQVLQKQDVIAGTKVQLITRQTYVVGEPGGAEPPTNKRLIVIAADAFSVNLRSLHDRIYAPPIGGEEVLCIIRSGVKIGGLGKNYLHNVAPVTGRGVYIPRGDIAIPQLFNPGGYEERFVGFDSFYPPVIIPAGLSDQQLADTYGLGIARLAANSFRTGDWPAGCKLTLLIEDGAAIYGEGGNGGGLYYTYPQSYGIGSGGNALVADYPITVQNLGIIAGGGASGRGSTTDGFFSYIFLWACGGGGVGYGASKDSFDSYELVGARGGRTGSNFWTAELAQYQGQYLSTRATDGSLTTPGLGGRQIWTANIDALATAGYGLATPNPLVPNIGQAGLAVIGNALITWTATGTRLGDII